MARPQTLSQSWPGLSRVLQRFRPELQRERGLLAGSLFALLMGTLLRLLEPWPLKIVFDLLLSGSSGKHSGSHHRSQLPFLDAWLNTHVKTVDPTLLLTVCALAAIAVVALRAAADFVSTVGLSLAGNRVLTGVRNELFRHLQELGMDFHTSARGGDLTVRVISDINMLRDVLVTAALPLLGSILVLVGMWAVMLALEWRLAVPALLTLPFLWLATARGSRRIGEAARVQRHREGDLASHAAEALSAIKIVQALTLEKVFQQRFVGTSAHSQKQDTKTNRLRAGLERSVDLLLAVATSLVLWQGAQLVIARNMTPGDLLVFLTYLRRAFNPMQDYAKYAGRLAKAAAAGERVLDLLDREPSIRNRDDAVSAEGASGDVRIENLRFRYESGPDVLQGISFEAPTGQRIALVGASGNGKSTLASLLLRLYDPQQGRILLDGRDLRDYKLLSLRQQMAVVMQGSLLFAASVRDNIALGATHPDVTTEEIEEAAQLANAHEFILALPEGYDTMLGERGARLSGGQQQRIAVARAAVRRAPILILDEPTVGLDEENERVVVEALERLSRGRTTFLITHDLRLASRSNLILHIEGGRIIESGSHDELMQQDGRYASLFLLQTATARFHDALPDGAPNNGSSSNPRTEVGVTNGTHAKIETAFSS